jgi:hypothetical protein
MAQAMAVANFIAVALVGTHCEKLLRIKKQSLLSLQDNDRFL